MDFNIAPYLTNLLHSCSKKDTGCKVIVFLDQNIYKRGVRPLTDIKGHCESPGSNKSMTGSGLMFEETDTTLLIFPLPSNVKGIYRPGAGLESILRDGN